LKKKFPSYSIDLSLHSLSQVSEYLNCYNKPKFSVSKGKDGKINLELSLQQCLTLSPGRTVMTNVAVAHTQRQNSAAAAAELAQVLLAELGNSPDALILFASPKYDFSVLLPELRSGCDSPILVGCSSAGEFTSAALQQQTACAIAFRSSDLHFAAGLGRELSKSGSGAARQLVDAFQFNNKSSFVYRSAMVMADSLAGNVEELVHEMTLLTHGMHQLFGGGAGDDARFERTQVFYGDNAYTDAAVALEILSNKPIGIGVRHGWEPVDGPYRVTESEGARVKSLNAAPAVEIFHNYAERIGQNFDAAEPLPFFLSNVIGISTEQGQLLRVPLFVNNDGSIEFAAAVPTGSLVHIMRASSESAAQAAREASESALSQLEEYKPQVALFFDCVATRLRTGEAFNNELEALQLAVGDALFVGCNTYGQIARSDGQFSGFHNCTAVVGIFPK
jgi:hypothetical protein